MGIGTTLLLKAAEAAAPVAKAGLMYKPSAAEKAYRESLSSQAEMLSKGTSLGEGTRQQMLATARGQAAAQTASELADVNRGVQGNAAGSGQAQAARSAAYDRQRQGMDAAQSQVNVLDAQAMQEAYKRYQEGMHTAAAMEYARRQAAMGELEKLSPEQVSAARAAGEDYKAKHASTTQGAADSALLEFGAKGGADIAGGMT